MNHRVLILISILLFSLVIFAAADDYHFLVKVYYSTPDELNSINQLGLDIWESHSGEFLVYARQKDLDNLTDKKIFYSMVADSKAKILEKLNIAVTDTTAFHTYDELSSELYTLSTAYPTICRLTTIGQSWENRQLYIMKISDNPGVDEPEPEICFLANQHAREWVTEEVALGLIEYLLQNYSTDTYVKSLVDRTQIWILPLANPDGKEYTHTTDRTWRKNRRNNGGGVYGVDLNRNFSYQWGNLSGGSNDSTSSVYFGPYAFSEPEDIAFRDFVQSRNLDLVINYHSYGQHIMYPWAWSYSPLSNISTYQALANGINAKITAVKGNSYAVGQWSVLLAYLGSGATIDWVWGTENIYCLTFELSPVGSPGFYIPESDIQPTIDDNIPGALYAIDWILQPTHIPDWSLYKSSLVSYK